jgi:hypothetical protein
MTALDAIAARLVSMGVGVLATTLFTSASSTIPSGNGPYIRLVATGGPSPEGNHNEGPVAIRRPTFQCTVHAKDPRAAQTRAFAAYNALIGTNLTLNGMKFLSVVPRQEPYELPMDETGHARWVFNVDTEHL